MKKDSNDKPLVMPKSGSDILPQPDARESILLGDYEFLGPYHDSEELKVQAGLLAMLVKTESEFELVDLQQSADVRRSARFAEVSLNSRRVSLWFAAYYATLNRQLEQIRDEILRNIDESSYDS